MLTFIQLGATRDGLDPYLTAAHARGMEAILIETPDYLEWRKALGRREFDRTIALEHPAASAEVIDAITRQVHAPIMLLAGFERYVSASYAAARHFDILPYCPGDTFLPLNKAEQRTVLTQKQVPVYQPNYLVLSDQTRLHADLLKFSYPYVIKPADGGGGLGVFLVTNDVEREQAWTTLQTLSNYDGGAFQGTMIEEYIAGTEYSVQGIVCDGKARCLTVCEKCIALEESAGSDALYGFRELGHIASHGDLATPELQQVVQNCVEAFEYRNGPFHADLIQASQGLAFLEMGFRLSGGSLVRLVERASGSNWAEEVFRLYLQETPVSHPSLPSQAIVGQRSLRSSAEKEAAQRLQQQGYAVEIELFTRPASAPQAPSLASDLLRHTGFIGRVIVSTSTVDEAWQLLEHCSAPSALAGGRVRQSDLIERGNNG